MAIEAIDHLFIETTKFDQSVAFWQGLGFSTVADWSEAGYRACRMASGETYIVMIESATPSTTVHFRITGADELAAALDSLDDVTVVGALEETHWNTRWLRVQDPDGNVFALEEGAIRSSEVDIVFDVSDAGEPIEPRRVQDE